MNMYQRLTEAGAGLDSQGPLGERQEGRAALSLSPEKADFHLCAYNACNYTQTWWGGRVRVGVWVGVVS